MTKFECTKCGWRATTEYDTKTRLRGGQLMAQGSDRIPHAGVCTNPDCTNHTKFGQTFGWARTVTD